MPSGEGGAVLDDVVRGPLHAHFVNFPACLIIWTDDVEVARCERAQHEVDGFF